MSTAKTIGATGTTATKTATTTRSEKEQAIIAAIKMLPKSAYGEYHYREELRMIIAKVMDYKICRFRGGTWTIAGFENPEKVKIIIKKMEAKGIIKFSKNRNMFLYTGE